MQFSVVFAIATAMVSMYPMVAAPVTSYRDQNPWVKFQVMNPPAPHSVSKQYQTCVQDVPSWVWSVNTMLQWSSYIQCWRGNGPTHWPPPSTWRTPQVAQYGWKWAGGRKNVMREGCVRAVENCWVSICIGHIFCRPGVVYFCTTLVSPGGSNVSCRSWILPMACTKPSRILSISWNWGILEKLVETVIGDFGPILRC